MTICLKYICAMVVQSQPKLVYNSGQEYLTPQYLTVIMIANIASSNPTPHIFVHICSPYAL